MKQPIARVHVITSAAGVATDSERLLDVSVSRGQTSVLAEFRGARRTYDKQEPSQRPDYAIDD